MMKARHDVANSIIQNLLKQAISWPIHASFQTTADSFNEMAAGNFPNIKRCIDGMHVPILKPLENTDVYFKWKKLHSGILQVMDKGKAVCGSLSRSLTQEVTCDMKFTDHKGHFKINSGAHIWHFQAMIPSSKAWIWHIWHSWYQQNHHSSLYFA